MTGPNFYTIDFARETVLQGKSTTFVSIARVDSELYEPSFPLSPNDDVYIIVIPSARNFESYASVSALTGVTGGPSDLNNTYNVGITGTFPNTDVLGFNNIELGMDVKNSYTFMPYGPTSIGPVIVGTNGPGGVTGDIVKNTGYPDYYIPLSSWAPAGTTGATAAPPVVNGPTAIHMGYWNEDGKHWKLNGKSIAEYEKIALSVPPSSSSTTTLQNIFDGTVEEFPAGILEGTGYVGRPPGGWVKLMYDTNLPNKSVTFRIDYDGEKDAHLKFNFIIFRRNNSQPNAPFNYKAPAYIPEGMTGGNNPVNYVNPEFGAKSGNPSGAISTTLDYQELHFFGYTETDVRTSRTTYQNSYTSETKLYDDRSSYGLLKTNPKISGNVKITLDSKGELWLNSIDANNELADSSYKKFPISSLSTYSRDLYRFFKNGQTPPSIIFDLYQVDDQYQNTKRTLSEQYDNFYNYGVEQLKNRYYDENFSFFAPIWLRKTVPDFFVIFRLDHPVAVDSYLPGETNEEFFNDFFKDARIVKTFDMREKSKLGSYLRKIVNDPRFKERPLDVSFESDTPTVWNGACYGDGTMSGKGEFLSDYWKIDRTVIDLEEYITGGFQRHGIISTNLINLEFLFDDEEAIPYSINRYFGLYVTENQLANFQIDPIALAKIQGQTPLPKKDVDGEPYSTKPFIQTNPNGIELPVNYYHNPSGIVNNTNVPVYQGEVVGKFPLPGFIDDPLRIFYVKDRDDAFKRIVELKEVDYGNPGTLDYRRVSQIKLFDNQEDISKYAGANQITSQFTSTLLEGGNSQLVLKLSSNDSDPVFADEEEIELTFNQYNADPVLHEYYLKVQSTTSTSVTFNVFKDLYTEKLGSSFTMPQVGGSVSSFSVTNASKFLVGQQIFITGAGYFEITSSNLTGNLISFKNIGNPQNATPMTAISANQFISVGGPSYISTYTFSPLSDELSIDTLLTLILNMPISGYSTSDMYKISVQNTEIIIDELTSSTNINAKVREAFQQFRWKMIANPIGLQPGDAWDYPVTDPNGYDYVTTFSNEGTPAQVAKAFALAVNSFDNRPCDALAIDDTIYLKAKKAGSEGNAIQLTRRMIDQKSNAFNLGFYERGNTEVNYSISNIEYPGYTPAPATIELLNKTGKVGTDYTYIKILKAPSGSYFQIRTEVDPTSLASAATSGSGVYFVTAAAVDVFSDPSIPFSIDISNLPDYVFEEYVIKIEVGPIESTQLFIGGSDRKRGRAKITYTDSQRYFNDRRTKRSGDIITGSNVISNVLIDSLYVGAKVAGDGIPANSYITYINSFQNSVTINNVATLGTSTLPYTTQITFDELSILNTETIKDQWYQTQKGTYTPMMPWNVQGKYVYSLPYLDEPTYDTKNLVSGYTDMGSYSTIQLENNLREFYQTYDKKIVAYNIYRPVVGIFSIFPIKDFDFDFYFSDYSYTPILEALRYYFNEEIGENESMLLPVDENYKLSLVDGSGSPLGAKVPLTIEGLNPNTKQWDYLETVTFSGSQGVDENGIIINTYYPYYVYDVFEQPQKWNDATVITANGVGLRNYMKRVISSKDINGNVTETQPLLYRLTMGSTAPWYQGAKVKITKNDYDNDKDLKTFPGFAAITDIYSPEDAEAVRSLLDDSKYVEAFLYQALRSEYDRLRENFNKEYALKSKVVPYINKWVQEGTDARDNYYRLNTSRAFGITNFSPDASVNFAEPSLLTNEFPYLDTLPKDYPIESLEGSRSYMFAKLSDIAKGTSSWHDLLTSNDDDDWFSKYFSLGYPTEKDQTGNLVPKSRDERYTFFTYNDGIKKSQSLFRGAKVQVLDINDQLIPPTEITESTKYNLYKFAAIARIVPPTPYTKEKPIDIEVYRNDKFKSIVMIINIHVQDYRIQSGLADYLFYYAVNDQLKNYNQKQVTLENVEGVKSLGEHSTIGITDFWPYTWKQRYAGYANYVSNTYTDLAVLRPRQGFFGGGYLELGDTRLGGIAQELNTAGKPTFVGGKLGLQYVSVDPGYEFSVLNEIIPTQDNYTDTSNSFTFTGSELSIQPSSFTVGGSLYKLINAVSQSTSIKHVDRSNARLTTDQYLPLQTLFSGTDKPIRSSITPGSITISEFLMQPGNLITTGSLTELETFNIKGGTSAYDHIKNSLTYASILSYVNSDSSFIEYYKIEDNVKTLVTDYKLRFVPQDQIIKTGVLSYVNDEDKPIEYVSSPLIGYNIVNTNQNEVVYRHRGLYEPRAIDILTFWVREDEDFTKHFNKDYLLFNTHLNNKSGLSGIIRNYGINKVADAEILQIPGGGAYKSVYPAIGEVSIDSKDLFILNSTWDKNYYRRYYELQNWNDVDGIEDMKEYKSFMGSKAMNVPKTQILETYNTTEATYTVTEPAQVVGVPSLSTTEYSLTDVAGNTKPILTIELDLEKRLLRKLYEDLALSTSFDEFTWLTTLGITEFQALTSTDIERLKKEYLTKNIIQLYEISEVKLYALSQEGLPIFDIEITDAEKISAGYRVDKDCKVVNTSQFGIKITKVLDTKKPYGYSVSATIKRI